jgi:rubrerythrin
MINELTELLDIAIDREIASEAFYVASQKKTADQGAIELMQELAREEAKHYQWIKGLKGKAVSTQSWHPEKVPDLMVSEYLIDTPISDSAMLQDVITAAMKREQYSMEFYSKMKHLSEDRPVKQLCERLMQEERNHKMKLEIFYDDLFYKEN